MNRITLPTVVVGNEFAFPKPNLSATAPARLSQSAIAIPVSVKPHVEAIKVDVVDETPPKGKPPHFKRLADLAHRHSITVFALLFLLVGVAAIKVGADYLVSHNPAIIKALKPVKVSRPAVAGLNATIPLTELDAKIEAIANQPASLAVGAEATPVSPDTIKSWLNIVKDPKKGVAYVSIRPTSISASLTEKANKYVKEPVNQVSVNHGAGDVVISAGRNGTKLTDPNSLNVQAQAVAKSVMDAKGLAFSTPLEPAPFQAVTPAAFPKMIEVNVVTKQMYLYQNGELFRSYPISAGAPETPTPIGQFKTYSKPAKQDMRGFNPDGSKYFQPNVKWINYFLPGGYAIHGNYWRPASWFGAINSSHGCVSLPEHQAKEVYDWAPIGTTVITHT